MAYWTAVTLGIHWVEPSVANLMLQSAGKWVYWAFASAETRVAAKAASLAAQTARRMVAGWVAQMVETKAVVMVARTAAHLVARSGKQSAGTSEKLMVEPRAGYWDAMRVGDLALLSAGTKVASTAEQMVATSADTRE